MRRNPQAGQALFLTAISLVVLVGMLGLGIDVGVLRYEKRLQQTAADAAALAGASNLPVNGAGSLGVVDGAKNASASNGFADTDSGSDCGASASVGTVCVQVNNPPQESATHNGDANYVEVLVSAVHPTYFARIFGKRTATVAARAVATNVGGGPNTPCLLSLSVSANLIVNGTINANLCSIIVNGDLQINGSIKGATSIAASGRCSGSSVPACVSGVPAMADPVGSLPTPPASGCSGGGLLGLLLNFCNGTVAGVLDLSGVSNPSDLYIISGASGLTLKAGAAIKAPGETLYSPNGLTLGTNSSVTANALIVGQPLTVDASVILNLGGSGNSPIKKAVLVE